jgi:hypothetical protein
MPPTIVPAGIDNAPVFDLCDARERRFLLELMQEENQDVVYDHPLPELHALLLALERMWGGEHTPSITVPPGLMYYLVIYATYAHHIPEDVAGWRHGAAHEVYAILQGLMESVALAIQDGTLVKHADDGVYIDLFRIPQWLYDEVVKDRPVPLEYELILSFRKQPCAERRAFRSERRGLRLRLVGSWLKIEQL